MAGASPLFGQLDDAAERVPASVTLTCCVVDAGAVQQVACLGDQQEDQAVHQSKELAVVVDNAELARLEPGSQLSVGLIGQEAGAQRHDGLFHAALEPVECSGALGARLVGPLLQHAVGRGVATKAGGVADQPAERPVGVLAAAEHRLQIEFAEGLARERGRIAQDSQAAAVGDDGPQVIVGAVEELLDHAVGRTLAVRAATIEFDPGTDEVECYVGGAVRHRVGLQPVIEHHRLGRLGLTEAQLLEEWHQPVGARLGLERGVARRGDLKGVGEALPQAGEPCPRTHDGVGDSLPWCQTIIFGAQRREVRVERAHPLEQVGGQQTAFGGDVLECWRAHAAPPGIGSST